MTTDDAPTKPSSSTQSGWHEREIFATCITRLEGAFAHRLAGGKLRQSQIDIMWETMRGWDDETIQSVTETIIGEFDSYPTVAEILRVKRHIDDERARPSAADVVATIADIPAPGAPWWWPKTIKSLKVHGAERIKIMEELIAEAQRRGEPEYDWHEREVRRYTDRHGRKISVRQVTNCGWARWKLDRRGQLVSGHCYRPEREVILV